MEVPIDPLNPEGEMRVNKPLAFWKLNSCRFPILNTIARDCVSVAASSGSIDQSFSTASDIYSAKRNGIKPDLFATLIFVKCNDRLNQSQCEGIKKKK